MKETVLQNNNNVAINEHPLKGHTNGHANGRTGDITKCGYHMDYSRYLNKLAKRRQPSITRTLIKAFNEAPAGIPAINMAAGMPNVKTFPFEEIRVRTKDGLEMTMNGKTIDTAMQYGASDGLKHFREQLCHMQKELHNPPGWNQGNRKVLVMTGAQEAISQTFEMMLEEGESVIVPEPTYPGVLTTINAFNPKIIPVATDENGVCIDSLRQALSPFDPEKCRSANHGVPKAIYTIPNGCNPSGFTISEERRKEIYKIAQQYNLLIIEDDPYFFLQYRDDGKKVPSFLSMDVDNRVLRMDSFAKVLAAGLRVGFMTGPVELIEKIEIHIQTSSVHPSVLSQLLISNLLDEWKMEGLLNHVNGVQAFYRKQRDLVVHYITKWLTGYAEWTVPDCGMFFWVKVNGIEDTTRLVMDKGLKNGLLLIPGKYFMVNESKPCAYIRVSFSYITEAEMDKGFKLLRDLIIEENRELGLE